MLKLEKLNPKTIYQIRIDETGFLQYHDGIQWNTLGYVVGKQGVQGVRGIQGKQGTQGEKGLSIKGEDGKRGLQGLSGKKGEQGVRGLPPRHEWNAAGTRLRFEQNDGSWGRWSEELKGEKGKEGKTEVVQTLHTKETVIEREVEIAAKQPLPPQQQQYAVTSASGASNYVRWRETT